MTRYELLLFLHIACVIAWLGAGTTVVVRLPLDGPQVDKGKTSSEIQAA